MCAIDMLEMKPLEQMPLEQKPLEQKLFNENPFEQDIGEQNAQPVMAPSQQLMNTMLNKDAQKKKGSNLKPLDKLEDSYKYFNRVVDNRQAEAVRYGVKSKELNLHAEKLVKQARPQSKKAVKQDSKKELSSLERKKLESRQKSDLKKAKNQGYSAPTGNTLAYKKSMEAANEKVLLSSDVIKERAALMNKSDICPSNLFEERYKNKKSPPHDMPKIMMTLETMREALKNHEGGAEGAIPDKKAEYATLKEISDKMEKVVEGILLANGMSSDLKEGDFSKVFNMQENGTASLIAEYTALASATGLAKGRHAGKLLDEPENKEYLDKAKENAKGEMEAEKNKLTPAEKAIFDNLPVDFSSFKEASSYLETVQKIDQHKDKYTENKGVVDAVIQNYTADCQFLANVSNKIAQIDEMEKAGKFSAHTAAHAKSALTECDKEYTMRSQNIKQNNMVLDVLLGVEGIPIDYHMYVQREYKITTDELKEYNAQIDVAKEKYLKEKAAQDDPKAKEYQDFLNEKPQEGKEAEYISRHILDYKKKLKNANEDLLLGSHLKHFNETTFTVRTARGLVKGYNVDEQNLPVTLQDQKNKDETKEILDAMVSGDRKKIAPVIDEIVKQVLGFNINVKSLSEEQFPTKATELLMMNEKLVNMENLFNENPWYEDEMDPILLQMLDEKIRAVSSPLGTWLSCKLLQMGINQVNGTLNSIPESEEAKEENQVDIDNNLNLATAAINKYNKRYKDMPVDVLLMKEVPEDRKVDLMSAKVRGANAPRYIVNDDFEELYTKVAVKKKGDKGDKGDKVDKVDPRLVTHFSPKYKLDKRGDPINPDEKEKAKEYAEAFASHEKEKMFPHIDKIVQDIMSIKLSADDYEDKNFYSNIGKIAQNVNSFLYIDNIKLDFPWYFDMKKEEDPEILEKLTKFHAQTEPYTELMGAKFGQVGIESACGNKIGEASKKTYAEHFTEEKINEKKQEIIKNNLSNLEAKNEEAPNANKL